MTPIAAFFVIAVACVSTSDADCDNRKLRLTVDNHLTQLFINGEQIKNLPNWNNWEKADTVPLNCDAKVIAVKGTDHGAVAGMLGSTDDGSVITNAAWKCTTAFYEGWMNWEYDDSKWPKAIQIGRQPMKPWGIRPGIRRDAYWIWTKNYGSNADRVVYCRRALVKYDPPGPPPPPPVCPDRELSIRVDNYINKLYIDGVEQTNLPNADDWHDYNAVALPCDAQVIAVQVTDDSENTAGILASTPEAYVLTNATWKCTSVYYSGWETVAYDDSAWPPAHVVEDHPIAKLPKGSPIREEAKWIWTDTYVAGGTVFCRKRLAGGNVQKVSQDETKKWTLLELLQEVFDSEGSP